jgi:hypothetical protein
MPAASIHALGNRPSEIKINTYYYFFDSGESYTEQNLATVAAWLLDLIPGLQNKVATSKLEKDTVFKVICDSACEECCVGFDKIKKSDNAISSLKVSPNYTAILWEHNDYGGMCEIFNNNVADLNSYDMGKCFNWWGLGSSDCTSSLKVFQKK